MDGFADLQAFLADGQLVAGIVDKASPRVRKAYQDYMEAQETFFHVLARFPQDDNAVIRAGDLLPLMASLVGALKAYQGFFLLYCVTENVGAHEYQYHGGPKPGSVG